MTVSIRLAVAADAPSLLAIEQQAANAAHWSTSQYSKLIEGGIVLVAETDGRVSGFICAKKIILEWEVENVAIAPDSLRRGIARELLLELVCRAQREHVDSIFLEVRESNVPARSLYEKRGFREAGRRRGYYRNPNEDAIVYVLQLKK